MHAERLLQLATFLRNVPPAKFDYSKYINRKSGDLPDSILSQLRDDSCGTTACAIGWCPMVWPDDWDYDVDSLPVLRGWTSTRESGAEWFGISYYQYHCLFLPDAQSEHFDNIQVAERIEAFIVRSNHD